MKLSTVTYRSAQLLGPSILLFGMLFSLSDLFGFAERSIHLIVP